MLLETAQDHHFPIWKMRSNVLTKHISTNKRVRLIVASHRSKRRCSRKTRIDLEGNHLAIDNSALDIHRRNGRQGSSNFLARATNLRPICDMPLGNTRRDDQPGAEFGATCLVRDLRLDCQCVVDDTLYRNRVNERAVLTKQHAD